MVQEKRRKEQEEQRNRQEMLKRKSGEVDHEEKMQEKGVGKKKRRSTEEKLEADRKELEEREEALRRRKAEKEEKERRKQLEKGCKVRLTEKDRRKAEKEKHRPFCQPSYSDNLIVLDEVEELDYDEEVTITNVSQLTLGQVTPLSGLSSVGADDNTQAAQVVAQSTSAVSADEGGKSVPEPPEGSQQPNDATDDAAPPPFVPPPPFPFPFAAMQSLPSAMAQSNMTEGAGFAAALYHIGNGLHAVASSINQYNKLWEAHNEAERSNTEDAGRDSGRSGYNNPHWQNSSHTSSNSYNRHGQQGSRRDDWGKDRSRSNDRRGYR